MRDHQVPDPRPALRGTDWLGPAVMSCSARLAYASIILGPFVRTGRKLRTDKWPMQVYRQCADRAKTGRSAGRRDLDRVDSDRSVCGVRADFDVDVDGCENDAGGTGPRTHSPLPPDNFLTCG